MEDQLQLSVAIGEINKMLVNRKRGTLFLRADDGHAYAVAYSGGEITGVSCGLIMGNEAVDRLLGIAKASFRFDATHFSPAGSRPDAEHVSRLCEAGNASPVAVEASSGAQGSEFHQRAFAVIEENLLEAMGPFARHILDEKLSSSAIGRVDPHNLRYVLSSLALEIDDKGEAERFVNNTIKALHL